ncbi:hypothetical protein ACHAXM_005400 [Skeletonema potamos]
MVKKSSSTKQREGGKAAAPIKVKVGSSKAESAAKKPKIRSHPIPKSWPVSSRLSYPPPAQKKSGGNTSDDDDEQFDILDTSAEQQTSANNNYLKPGKLLQQNCNGCDVFLRKSAVQSTSASIPTKTNSSSKGAAKRFLIVFPGRMTLKAPTTAQAATAVPKDDASKDEKDDDINTNKDNNNKRNPFAPANPPQLLGRLVSLGGAERRVELRIPFPSKNDDDNNNNNPDDNDDGKTKTNKKQHEQQHQMVMSGRAIPLSGKFMVLSFKRTGGKDSNTAVSTPKNKKMGTGSIACKDIFRSVIVLGESKMLDNWDDKKLSVTCSHDKVKPCHYGGSERTLDGGGTNDANTTAAKRSFKVAAPTSLKKNHDGDVSSAVDSLGSDDDDEADDDIEIQDGNSDDEFVPTSSKKRRSASASKNKKSDSDEDTPVAMKRTPRRSAAKATNVSYVDDDSNVDMSDDESGKSPIVTQEINNDSDVSSVIEEIVPNKKQKVPAAAAPSSKKRKLSGGSSCNTESSCIVIDSDDDIKTPKQAANTNGTRKAAGSKGVSSKKAKAKEAVTSSPLKSVSPHRRKKVSPKKPSPKKASSLDLDDDPFAFL